MPVSDRDSSLYVWIDQDLGAIRQIAPKMYYVHSLLSVSCFAEFCEKWTGTRNANKSAKMAYYAMMR